MSAFDFIIFSSCYACFEVIRCLQAIITQYTHILGMHCDDYINLSLKLVK